ncbi:hypothetical protein [Clavibacter californiensis]|uniref:Transmembrane protein n=1 Tax=Clavibacter californiensis TaxID=1401995 RepID=A0ABX9N5V6_9MICO|nr:hypothetical protein [Clavibacter californiensis]RII92293.1 hypothetical protein DZF98_07425 [Clavibacter californiensis]UKF81072.1 hypothetical protein FGD68_05315 [Clavibacter californiensis]
MENDRAADAAAALDGLRTDRETLAARIPEPRWHLAGFGAIALAWVAQAATLSPGADYEPPTTSWVAVAAAVVLLVLIRRRTGIRFRRVGARAVLLVSAAVVACLVLFSISLGLVALGIGWGVAITALAAAGLVTWLATLAFRAAVREIARRG